MINTEKQLMVLSDSRWQDCSDNSRSTGASIVFYQGGPIDNCTHVPGPFSQLNVDSEYTVARTSVISLSHLRMINNELLEKYTDLVP